MSDQTASQSELPTVPPTWENDADKLYRIVSADEKAVAWLCPGIGGNTVAYAVKIGERWVQILDVATPAQLRRGAIAVRPADPLPVPWPHAESALPVERPDHRGATDLPWYRRRHPRLRARAPLEADPSCAAGATCELRTPDDLDEAQAASYPFTVRITQDIDMGEHGELLIRQIAVNEGDEPAPVAFGLHPYFGEDIIGADRTRVHVDLPGASERVRTGEPAPYMTGERSRRRPIRQRRAARADDGDRPYGLHGRRRHGDHPRPAAHRRPLGLDGRFLDDRLTATSCFFAPPAQNSISLEPQSHMPGCASLPEGHPDGLVGLAPGATLEAVTRIQLVPPAS